eukprot:TRINITY_DN2025_c0_g1_i3.p1 TRINITY_DN2025_c0_g1~~TRINITY_DN2025_c0_g1_i3.p1  ORF type:complete len:103 (-),score=21.18 TRINITY_DN2025_c0_g1_i3:92-400(-)
MSFSNQQEAQEEDPSGVVREEAGESAEEDRLLIEHLRPSLASQRNYKGDPIELRNHSEEEPVEELLYERAEPHDAHMSPDTVLLDMDNDSIPVDLTFFRIGS